MEGRDMDGWMKLIIRKGSVTLDKKKVVKRQNTFLANDFVSTFSWFQSYAMFAGMYNLKRYKLLWYQNSKQQIDSLRKLTSKTNEKFQWNREYVVPSGVNIEMFQHIKWKLFA